MMKIRCRYFSVVSTLMMLFLTVVLTTSVLASFCDGALSVDVGASSTAAPQPPQPQHRQARISTRQRRNPALQGVSSASKQRAARGNLVARNSLAVEKLERRGGGGTPSTSPSFYWAIFHNWMYFLSLGFNLINVPFMIRSIVDGPPVPGVKSSPSPQAIALSGKVESVDKLLTFLGVGLLSALSDKLGRKPLMAWSVSTNGVLKGMPLLSPYFFCGVMF